MDEELLRKTAAKNIAEYRKAHHDTQLDLAGKLNYSDKAVSKWERGESLPDIYILSKLASLYGITVSTLIGEVEPPKEERPHYHLFILALSVALVFAIATVMFSAFLIFDIHFAAWLFYLYAIPVSAIIAVVFTSLWWNYLWQGIAITVLIWSMGLSVHLSLSLTTSITGLSSLYAVCAAMQVLVILWEVFRQFRARGKLTGKGLRKREKAPKA